jgi:hypothetical protein
VLSRGRKEGVRENLRLQLLVIVFAILASTIGFGATASAATPSSQGANAVASTPSTAAAETAEGPAFGMSLPALVNESASQQAATLAALYGTGLRWVRIDANWGYWESSPGVFNWAAMDQTVSLIRAQGMSIDFIIDGVPAWAASVPSDVTLATDNVLPASASQFGGWAQAVATRYGSGGPTSYEIWNEENLGVLPAPNPAIYTADLQAAYNAITAVQPNEEVVTGGLAPAADGTDSIAPVEFLQDIYADGGAGYFNAVADHPYSYPALPNTVESWSGFSQMSATSPSIRSVMVANGDASKQIWITEVGAPSAGPNGVGLTNQATEITQVVDDAESTSWIGALFVYTYQDSATNPDYFGLVNADGSPKPAWAALAAAIGAPPACSIASQTTVTLGQPCDVDVSGTDPAPAVAAPAVAAPAAATPEVATPLLLPLAASLLGGIWLGFRKRRRDRHEEVAAS